LSRRAACRERSGVRSWALQLLAVGVAEPAALDLAFPLLDECGETGVLVGDRRGRAERG
jgi:hypothetical protein